MYRYRRGISTTEYRFLFRREDYLVKCEEADNVHGDAMPCRGDVSLSFIHTITS